MSKDKRFGRLTVTRREGQGVVLFRDENPKHHYRLKLIDIQEGGAKMVISVPDTLQVKIRRNWGTLGIAEFEEELMPHKGQRFTIVEEGDIVTLDGNIELNALAVIGDRARVRVTAPIDVEIWRDELASEIFREGAR
jgi:hypothetical protein